MILLSKLTDYGVTLMTRLAQRREEGCLSARDLAESAGLPLPTVSKLLKILAREGLLESQRGIKGGYRLARAPREIGLSEILLALEGPVSLTACGNCEMDADCSMQPHWNWINQRVLQSLEDITLADLSGSTLLNLAAERRRESSSPSSEAGTP